MSNIWRPYLELERSWQGVKSPAEMGTTGLVGWVITGPRVGRAHAWNRARRAAKVIRDRGLPLERFAAAVLASTPNRAHREQFRYYFDTIMEGRQ